MKERSRLFKGWMATLLGIFLILLSLSLTQGSLAGGAVTPQSTSTSSLPAGDAARGRELFMGSAHFTNGGPPCMACHNIGSNGLLGGGTLGPDLTNVSSRYSDADLGQTLNSLPWPVMKPIFTEHPLTPQEQADLRTFLEASAGQPEANQEPLIFGISLAGLVAVTGAFGWIYRRRLRGVRKALLQKARSNDTKQGGASELDR
ncbi:MAG TPA: c-type cytochrome [Anaerolineales bacterium]|nr:c-type cytochrome [Anaerolineales bacterium]